MFIARDRKCKICGAHAPMEDDTTGLFRCMTCAAKGSLDEFPIINGLPGSEPAPTPRATMTNEEFKAFVADRWNTHMGGTGRLEFSDFEEDGQQRVMRFALSLINEAP